MNQHYIILLERKAIGRLIQLKTGKITVTQARFDYWLNEIRQYDESLYEEMGTKYVNTLKQIKNNLTNKIW
jgi:hypothetical protein